MNKLINKLSQYASAANRSGIEIREETINYRQIFATSVMRWEGDVRLRP